MQASFSFYADLSEQRIVSQDKVECKVTSLRASQVSLLESRSTAVHRPSDVGLKVMFSVYIERLYEKDV